MTLYSRCESVLPQAPQSPEHAPSLRLLRALALKRRLEDPKAERDVPLCVSLEGALVRSRVTHEALLALVRTRPWKLASLLPGIGRGRGLVKERLGQIAHLDPAILPYRRDALRFLRDQAEAGRTLVLVGSADHATVRAVADHLGLFAYCLGSDERHDLRAGERARLLCSMFGPGGFDYLGEGSGDIPAWSTARRAVIVSPRPRLLDHSTWNSQTADVLAGGRASPLAWIDALRPLRWPRSLLVFAPLAAQGQVTVYNLVALYCAFCALALVAAACDLVSDMMHLPEDRRDPVGRRRPLAAGHMAFDRALVLAAFAAGLGFVLATVISPLFAAWLALYPVLALAYAFRLKRIAGVDVLTFAALDLHRLAAGAIALGIMPYFWQMAFATPFLIGAAAWHRHGALLRLGRGRPPVEQAEYRLLPMLGMAAGYVSVLALALYAYHRDPARALGAPQLVWALCPVVLYGVTVAWMTRDDVLARMRGFRPPALRAAVLIAVLISAAAILFRDAI